MGSKGLHLGPKAHLPFKTGNKARRQALHIKRKKALDTQQREKRFRRRKEELNDPQQKEKRLARNQPATLDKKRTWDNVVADEEDQLGLAVDVERLKRQRTQEDDTAEAALEEPLPEEERGSDVDSMLEEDLDDDDEDDASEQGSDEDESDNTNKKKPSPPQVERSGSPSGSTMSTRFDLTPEALAAKFPSLFKPPADPKILITTSINSTLHAQAELLTELFPNSNYIRRSAHRYGHKYSVREIAKFAANRGYTSQGREKVTQL
ncbi:MAG: hypothetical protein INR71_15850, partial [Terriglobus roseus]|nr:hypothetical protein [Terriglobus roseus]